MTTSRCTLDVLVARQGGVFLRHQARECGYGDHEMDSLLRQRRWVRVRRGAYADRLLYQSLDARGRHVLRLRAYLLSTGAPTVASHLSAAAVLGLDIWGVDLDRELVYVTRNDGQTNRVEGGVVHHSGQLAPDDVTEIAGIPCTTSARTAVDVAASVPFEPAVVVADSALRQMGKHSGQALRPVFDRMSQWPGARSSGRVLNFASGLSGSVGESRGRVLFYREGLPTPDLQVTLVDATGEAFANADFVFFEEMTVRIRRPAEVRRRGSGCRGGSLSGETARGPHSGAGF